MKLTFLVCYGNEIYFFKVQIHAKVLKGMRLNIKDLVIMPKMAIGCHLEVSF